MVRLGEITSRGKDLVLAQGERMSAQIFAHELGIPTRVLNGGEAGVVTDDCWGFADPLTEMTNYEVRTRLRPLLAAGVVPIVTGFDGATTSGATTTLGRGGSDLSATLIGNALDADEIWLCSDVEGLLAADPRIVPNAKSLAHLSLGEAIEMVSLGTKGIHPRALFPLEAGGRKVQICSTFAPDGKSTIITARGDGTTRAITSLHLLDDVTLLRIAGPTIEHPGMLASFFETLGHAEIRVRTIAQSAANAEILLTVQRADADRAQTALQGSLVAGRFNGRISRSEGLAIVAVVGRGLAAMVGSIMSALTESGAEVHGLVTGTLSMSILVGRDGAKPALRALHDRLM
jgi:aspartate kinase